ncbi:MAG: hypothetical protein BWX44_00597 [Spirochaetes bacterium ADurb.Bin001]|nr:MAG: hypothetical protein BWX44_00597 [Spirochaetes bacterium ADurb.Bin001]
MKRGENAAHVEPQIAPSPFLRPGMHVAAQTVGVHQPREAPARFRWRPQGERQERRAVVAPAAEVLQPRFPAVIVSLADEQAPQARRLRVQPARQREPFPVVPGIMPEGGSAHVEAEVEFGRRRRSLGFPGRRQAGSQGFLAFANHGGYSELKFSMSQVYF